MNRESTPLEITGLEPAGTHFKASITPVKPGETYRLDVTVPADAELGRFMASLVVRTNRASMPALKVAVNVLVKPELYVNPEVVDLGRIVRSELAADPELVRRLEQRLIVRKRAGDFTIKSVTTDVPAVRVSVSSDGRAQAFQIDLTVAPERLVAGRLSGKIRIETDDKNFPVLEVPIAADVR